MRWIVILLILVVVLALSMKQLKLIAELFFKSIK